MPAVSLSTFYVPLPEERPRHDDEPLYACIDDLSGYESPYDHLRQQRPSVTPSHYDGGQDPAAPRPNRNAADYEPIGPRRGSVDPQARTSAFKSTGTTYFELERTPPEPPPQHLKPGRRSPMSAVPVAIAPGLRHQFEAVNSELAQRLAKRHVD